MKSILAIALALVVMNGYAQVQSAGSLSGTTTSGLSNAGGNSMSNSNSSQRPPGSEQAPTATDSVGTRQSSTLNNNSTNNNMNNNMRNMPQNKMNTLPGRSNCIDNSGRSFASSDAGYTGCLNSMRAR